MHLYIYNDYDFFSTFHLKTPLAKGRDMIQLECIIVYIFLGASYIFHYNITILQSKGTGFLNLNPQND